MTHEAPTGQNIWGFTPLAGYTYHRVDGVGHIPLYRKHGEVGVIAGYHRVTNLEWVAGCLARPDVSRVVPMAGSAVRTSLGR